METKLLKGAPVRKYWTQILKEEVEKRGKMSLHVILVGEDPSSLSYIKSKEKRANKIGVEFVVHKFDENAKEEDVIDLINKLNKDGEVTGILPEMPMPSHISEKNVIEAIHPDKDVDCLTSYNQGRLFAGDMTITPSTPRAALEIALYYGYKPSDMETVVVGRSRVVGMPLVRMLLSKEEYGNSTVTVCHSRTDDLSKYLKRSDLVFLCAGKYKFIGKNQLKEGAVVIDIGVNEKDGNIAGDANFEELQGYVSAITPVPGGVGPLTATFIFRNLIKLYDRQNDR